MCFAMGVGVVKGDQSTAVFRGSKAPLGRRGDRSSLASSQTSSFPSIHTIYNPPPIVYTKQRGSGFHRSPAFSSSVCFMSSTPCVFECQLNTDVFMLLTTNGGPCCTVCAAYVLLTMLWLEGATDINCSCCLISPGNSTRFQPTGVPPKPSREQGTPTQPAGTQDTNTTAATAAQNPHTRTHSHTHFTLNSLSSSCHDK